MNAEAQYLAHVVNAVQSLRRALISNDDSWVKVFIDLGGVEALMDTLLRKTKKFGKTNIDINVELETIRCIKTLMNMEFGLNKVCLLACIP